MLAHSCIDTKPHFHHNLNGVIHLMDGVISILLQWLPSSSTHSYSHEVLWTASHATHQVCPPPPSLDPFQFAYRSNRSTDDAIATALHPALTHLDKKDSYVRMLFIDFIVHSSAFNTIIPQQLTHKLVQLGLNTSLCNWLLDFLTGRPQAVRVGSNTSSTITLNTGAPQGCVLSPLLFTLLTHDCTPSHNSVVHITEWWGVHITEDLSWTNNTAALAKKAQQRLYFLRKLRRARAPTPVICTFYRGTIESILTSCITVWYGACNASCRKSLQRIVRAAEKIVGVSLPSLQDIYSTRLTRKALSIAGDPTHPTHSFFSLLPSGRRLRSLQARTSRWEGQLHPSGCQEAELPPVLAPPPLFYPTQHWTLTLQPPPSSPHPQDLPPPPPPLQTVTRTSHFVQHWTDLYLIQHCL